MGTIVLTYWQTVDTTPPRDSGYGTLIVGAVVVLFVVYGFYRLGKSRASRSSVDASRVRSSQIASEPVHPSDSASPLPRASTQRSRHIVEPSPQGASGDVFISYASADRPRAQALAAALSRSGFSTWWDRTIPPGKSFDEVIETALACAKCVVVLWSKTSVASDWVKVEAADAAKRRILIPALLEEVTIPLEFRRLQAADLVGWDGSNEHPGFLSLVDSIGKLPGITKK